MARRLHARIILSAKLCALDPLHVGGLGGGVDSDLPLARNGRGEFYIPGSSLAGALRQGRNLPTLWGGHEKNDEGASRILVDDAVVQTGRLTSVRQGVGIDRWSGAAAEGIKYDRQVLASGTTIPLTITFEIGRAEDESEVLAEAAELEVLLRSGRFRLGAARTRGIGRVKAEPIELVRQEIGTRAGLLAHLNGLKAAAPRLPTVAAPARWLDISVAWKPVGPVCMKAEYDGVGVDTLPLVIARDNQRVEFLLQGGGLKGVLRTRAEKIVRTLLHGSPGAPPDPVAPEGNVGRQKFLGDLCVPLVDELFGSVDRMGAVAVFDCVSEVGLDAHKWEKVERAKDDRSLAEALRALRPQNPPPRWSIDHGMHVAIDRWTGGAADHLLYSVLELWNIPWSPMTLELDERRLPSDLKTPARVLLYLVLRDLCLGRVPLGFGTQRHAGTLVGKAVTITQSAGMDAAAGDLEKYLAHEETKRAWKEWLAHARQGLGNVTGEEA